jgi:hypothetical protein
MSTVVQERPVVHRPDRITGKKQAMGKFRGTIDPAKFPIAGKLPADANQRSTGGARGAGVTPRVVTATRSENRALCRVSTHDPRDESAEAFEG